MQLTTPSNTLFYCGGAAMPIHAEGAVNYTWSPAQGLSATTGGTVLANPTTTTNYMLEGTDANGCIGYYPFTVFVAQPSQITLNTGDAYILPGQAIPLTATGGSGNYTWSPAAGLNQTSGNSVLASPTQTTVYTVRGTGCDIEQTVTIYVLPETSPTDNALDFDGLDDYVEMPEQSQGISGTFTVAFWVKPTHPTKTMHVFSTRNGANGNTFDIQVRNGNQIHGDIGNGTDWLTTNADALFSYQANQWMHIAYKITPGQYKIFVNGNLIQTGNYPGTAVLYNSGSNFITLGKNNDENTKLQGSIDDLMISTFNFPDEIMSNAPRFGIPAQIRYTFDAGIAGGSNPTVTLLSNQDIQSGMHGTLHNFTLNGNTSNWVVGQSVQPQTIAMAGQNSVVYGTTYNPGATTSSGLAVTYFISDPSIASVSGNVLQIHNTGTITIFAQQDGNAFYENAEPKAQQLTITAKPLTIANASALNKIYDR
ncbi:MAG TPA: LamG domain-containing protein, partial [Fibrella sp.]